MVAWDPLLVAISVTRDQLWIRGHLFVILNVIVLDEGPHEPTQHQLSGLSKF